MKKLLALTIVCISLAAVVLSGCYVTKAARKRDMLGIYELTTYTYDGKNLLEEDKIVNYLVIPESGYGYYVYKEGDFDYIVQEMTVNFIPDETEPNKYSYIEYRLSGDSENTKLGYVRGNLNANRIRYRWINNQLTHYYVYTSFNRITKKTQLSYLEDKIGKLPPALSYNTALFDGVYSYQFEEFGGSSMSNDIPEGYENPYVYWYVDLELSKNKATSYYMLKEDEVAVVKEHSISLRANENGTYTLVSDLSPKDLAEVTLERKYLGASYAVYMYIPIPMQLESGECDVSLVFTPHERYSFDIEYQRQDRINWYNQSKPQEEDPA